MYFYGVALCGGKVEEQHVMTFKIYFFLLSEIMLQMGFSRDEIQEALTNNRYDEVMATYLLLDEKRQKLTVRLILVLHCKF